MLAKQIVFTQKDRAELLNVEAAEPGPDEVLVRTCYSAVSCGTERANITGNANISVAEGPNVSFPRYAGYSSSGIVLKTGEAVSEVKVGDRVVVSWGSHKSCNVVNEANVTRIESDRISMAEASLLHIGSFSMAAIRKTRLETGESALVMGLGILGLLAVQLARAAGAVPVIAADPVKERRGMALTLGADYAFDPLEADFAEQVKSVTGGGVNSAIEVTGRGEGLNQALDCMARYGRVALLGCTRASDFTVDYYRKVHGPGISLIGAHTLARPSVESSAGWFTQRDDIRAIMRLCQYGRIDLTKMICEVHSPETCSEVYDRLVQERNFPPVALFRWEEEA